MVLSCDDCNVSALFFGANLEKAGINVGDIVNVAASMNINEFRNDKTPQLICRDIELVSHYEDDVKESRAYFESVMSGDVLIQREDIPIRADFAKVYTFFKSIFPYGTGTVSIKRVSAECELTYIKLFCIIHALFEGDIIKYDRTSEFDYRITLLPTEGKSDLTKTSVMKKIMNNYR
jgi:hypothetical protein